MKISSSFSLKNNKCSCLFQTNLCSYFNILLISIVALIVVSCNTTSKPVSLTETVVTGHSVLIPQVSSVSLDLSSNFTDTGPHAGLYTYSLLSNSDTSVATVVLDDTANTFGIDFLAEGTTTLEVQESFNGTVLGTSKIQVKIDANGAVSLKLLTNFSGNPSLSYALGTIVHPTPTAINPTITNGDELNLNFTGENGITSIPLIEFNNGISTGLIGTLTLVTVANPALTVTNAGTGIGVVTSDPTGISCGSNCTENYTSGTLVTLTVVADTGSNFGGWSGCDNTPTTTTCEVTMSGAKNVTATFDLALSCTPATSTDITGDYSLVTQADVNALTNVNKIIGNLTLAPNTNNLDFSPLEFLKEVTGDFYLQYSNGQVELSGFECLTTIGGDFHVFNNNKLEKITGFANLTTVSGFLTIYNNFRLDTIDSFPKLSYVGDDFWIGKNIRLTNIGEFTLLSNIQGFFRIADNFNLVTISGFPLLSTIDEYFSIVNNANLVNIANFPELIRVGTATVNFALNGLNIAGNDSLSTTPSFPKLTTLYGGLSIGINNLLTNITSFSVLKEVFGGLLIEENPLLKEIPDFPVLTTVGSFFYVNENNVLETIGDFPLLDSVGLSLHIRENPVLTEIPEFVTLDEIGSQLTISENHLLSDIADFPVLARIDGPVYIYNNALLNDISGFPILNTIGGYFRIQSNAQLSAITGLGQLQKSSVTGSLSIFNNPNLDCTAPTPSFTPIDFSIGNLVNCSTM